MRGFIVVHKDFGLGKIEDVDRHVVRVRFFYRDGDQQVAQFAVGSLRNGTLRRARLESGSECAHASNTYRVRCILDSANSTDGAWSYEVIGDEGKPTILSEIDLVPIPSAEVESPIKAMAELRPQSFGVFARREKFARAYDKTIYSGFGIRALLSSRVDLRAHQAFVAATILRDPVHRYILADEVGLGKTIEAGLVIHDLLAVHSAARVLIVCPGSLSQQWLCEMYSKFGGYVFRLFDRYSTQQLTSNMFQRVIVSYGRTLEIAHRLVDVPWDLVVIDEAHHLLMSQVLYRVAHELSARSRSLLLLSAIPAQRREDEFLRLLELLEPGQHLRDVSSFKKLFEVQPAIGRRLHMFERRLNGLETGEYATGEVVAFANRFLELDVVGSDTSVRFGIQKMESADSSTAARLGRKLVHYIGDRYRINRRILRNRRQRLIAENQVVPIVRSFRPADYTPDQLEIETSRAVGQMLDNVRVSAKIDADVKIAAIRTFCHAAIWPHVLYDLLNVLLESESGNPTSAELDFLRLGFASSYGDWDVYTALLCRGIRNFVKSVHVHAAIRYARDWAEFGKFHRFEKLISDLRSKLSDPANKVLVFAGLHGLAADVARGLRIRLAEMGSEAVTEFRHDLNDEEKEENVRRFQNSARVRVLVSDESGGEGRNFQFASEIVHFDVPWFAGRLEQRIGRLDRLGREQYRKDVISTVIFPGASLEASLVDCLANGLEVFTRSISGLEFALREAEDLIAMTALEGGRDALDELVPRLRQIADEERSRDEADAVLDAGSFDSAAAERFRRMSIPAVSEQLLEREFVEYFRCLTNPRSARDFPIPGYESRGWEFNADNLNVRNLKQDLGGNSLPMFRGTFYRKVAQGRPDLNFFQIGNPLFNTIANSLEHDLFGRTYAIQLNSVGIESWTGFELVFYPEFATKALTDMTFQIARRPLHLFYSIDGKLCDPADHILALRQRLGLDEKGRSWRNFTNERASLLLNFTEGRSWEEITKTVYAQATVEAQRRLSEQTNSDISNEKARLGRLIESLPKKTTEHYRSYFAAALDALENWHPRLDSVGFLAINQEGGT